MQVLLIFKDFIKNVQRGILVPLKNEIHWIKEMEGKGFKLTYRIEV